MAERSSSAQTPPSAGNRRVSSQVSAMHAPGLGERWSQVSELQIGWSRHPPSQVSGCTAVGLGEVPAHDYRKLVDREESRAGCDSSRQTLSGSRAGQAPHLLRKTGLGTRLVCSRPPLWYWRSSRCHNKPRVPRSRADGTTTNSRVGGRVKAVVLAVATGRQRAPLSRSREKLASVSGFRTNGTPQLSGRRNPDGLLSSAKATLGHHVVFLAPHSRLLVGRGCDPPPALGGA